MEKAYVPDRGASEADVSEILTSLSPQTPESLGSSRRISVTDGPRDAG